MRENKFRQLGRHANTRASAHPTSPNVREKDATISRVLVAELLSVELVLLLCPLGHGDCADEQEDGDCGVCVSSVYRTYDTTYQPKSQ